MPVTKEAMDRIRNDTPMAEAFTKIGITPEHLARRLKAELVAKTVKAVKVKAGGGDGGGEIVDIEAPDWRTRQQARQDAHRLLGHYPAEKREQTLSGALDIAAHGTSTVEIGPSIQSFIQALTDYSAPATGGDSEKIKP